MNNPSTETARLKQGDYSALAADYALYRPGYASTVRDVVLRLNATPASEQMVTDLGAGTGIWTRMLASAGVQRLYAIEPNEAMRERGVADSAEAAIEWLDARAEATTLPDRSIDLATAASCFHWFDYVTAIRELERVLKPGGWFVALWNTRLIETSPLLVEIDAEQKRLAPTMQRKSSGRGAFAEGLAERFAAEAAFHNFVYLEGRHVQQFTPAQYTGVWRSVNDVQAQMGPQVFQQFLDYIETRTNGLETIDATYLTRAWCIQKK